MLTMMAFAMAATSAQTFQRRIIRMRGTERVNTTSGSFQKSWERVLPYTVLNCRLDIGKAILIVSKE